jgi:hypothetical protein
MNTQARCQGQAFADMAKSIEYLMVDDVVFGARWENAMMAVPNDAGEGESIAT